MILYSKAFQKSDAADKRGEESEEHECPNKFEVSFKIMEVDAIMEMVEDTLHHFWFIINVIVSNDGVTMWDVLKHP